MRALPGAWETVIAPVLVCEYVERRPKLQFGDAPFVVVRYGEAQHFKVQRGSRSSGARQLLRPQFLSKTG